MAHIDKVYIHELLQLVCEDFETNIGAKTYSEHRPLALQDLITEFLVLSFPVIVRDRNAYQTTNLRVSVYVKNKANGVVNTLRLGELTQSIYEQFPYISGRYSITKPKLTLQSDDGLGFTVWTIQANVLINSTDSYSYD